MAYVRKGGWGGARAGAGRKKKVVTKNNAYEYYEKLLKKEKDKAGIYSTVKNSDKGTFDTMVEIKMSNDSNMTAKEATEEIFKEQHRTTKKQVESQVKNVRENIKKAKNKKAKGESLTDTEKVLAEMDARQVTVSGFYIGSSTLSSLLTLADINDDADSIFGS